MASFPIFADFPKVGDFRFTDVNDPTNENYLVGGVYQFDQKPFIESNMPWQFEKPYYQKRTFNDKCTVYLNSQINEVGDVGPYPLLELLDGCKNVIDVPINSFPTFVGGQQIVGNTITITDPATGTPTVYDVNCFLWQFYLSQFLDPDTDSGIYYLRMTVYSSDPAVSRQYISEPIYVYDSFPNTVLLEGKNLTNRKSQHIVVSGWGDFVPTFQQRVEGFPIRYSPKTKYVNYLTNYSLQGNYINRQRSAEAWRTWGEFKLGGIDAGIPYYLLEKINELFITDLWTINGKGFTIDNDGGESIQSLWEIDDPEASALIWAHIPVRERFANEEISVVLTPTPDLRLWRSPWQNPDIVNPSPGDFMPYGVPYYAIVAAGPAASISPVVFDSQSQEDTYISTFSGIYPALGGSIYRDTDGWFYFTTASGAAYISGDAPIALYKWYTLFQTIDATPKTMGFRYASGGLASGKIVIDYADGTIAYTTTPAGAPTVTVAHTFPALSPGEIPVRCFHNDEVARLEFIESLYTSTSKIIKITDMLPAKLTGLDISTCSRFAYPSGVISLDISMCTVLNVFGFRQNGSCTSLSVFNDPAPLKNVTIQGNAFDATATDVLINGFVNNTWDGLSTSGVFILTNTPSAAPTAASLTSRNALTAKSWTQTYNP